MRKQYFYFQKLDWYDKISILIYLIATLIVYKGMTLFENVEIFKQILLFYTFLTPLLLYVLCYKSLRNFYVFLVWIMFSLFHLHLYVNFIQLEELEFVRGHGAHGLQFTLVFVLFFQILRIIHLRLFGYELVSLGANGARTDIFDNRRIKLPDTISFIFYFASWILIETVLI